MASVRLLVSSVIGYVVAALLNAILVVVKEINEGFFTWLATTFGHHWIGHGILVVLAFIIGTLIGFGVYRGDVVTEKLSTKLILTIIITTLVSVFIIAGFMASRL